MKLEEWEGYYTTLTSFSSKCKAPKVKKMWRPATKHIAAQLSFCEIH